MMRIKTLFKDLCFAVGNICVVLIFMHKLVIHAHTHTHTNVNMRLLILLANLLSHFLATFTIEIHEEWSDSMFTENIFRVIYFQL